MPRGKKKEVTIASLQVEFYEISQVNDKLKQKLEKNKKKLAQITAQINELKNKQLFDSIQNANLSTDDVIALINANAKPKQEQEPKPEKAKKSKKKDDKKAPETPNPPKAEN